MLVYMVKLVDGKRKIIIKKLNYDKENNIGRADMNVSK